MIYRGYDIVHHINDIVTGLAGRVGQCLNKWRTLALLSDQTELAQALLFVPVDVV